ncbi:MAG: class I SAM-dependent methyltransferase [Bacteroidales bacterium]|nr:class I SAM-dependent methyltransferase [Bacteroidales bacterium]MBN2749774.1 class I SAM-dependent methyltransferase [Bacteroidales bacterium]
MKAIETTGWTEYELIDTGNFEKLERFGDVTVARPEPQAVWNKSLSQAEWDRLANAYFVRNKEGKQSQSMGDSERGEWRIKPRTKEQWYIQYKSQQLNLSFRLGLTSFKHVGLFPEQANNWEFIFKSVQQIKEHQPTPKVLNLFAYTGGASLAAKAAGADTTHVDSVKQVVSWAKENMEASHQDNIRWIVDDALKFAQREVRRGNTYNGIILDPPAYGRGPQGEKWILEENINEIVSLCKQLLQPQHSFLVLNLYSMGLSALVGESLVKSIFGELQNIEVGESFITDSFNKKLPLGVFIRFQL